MLRHLKITNFLDTESLGFSFIGKMLMENIKKEWRINSILQCDETTFEVDKLTATETNELLKMVEKLPFSVTTIQRKEEVEEISRKASLADYFQPSHYIILNKTSFCYPSSSTAFFHKLQRDRRIWWRKLSSLPGRFKATESHGNMSVEITADFDWGVETIEKIYFDSAPSSLQVKDGRKTVGAHAITSELKLEVATLVYMCDAFEIIDATPMMRFHRKLSPFSITFAISAASASVAKDLMDLALVLARRIRKVGVSCLLLPNISSRNFESTFRRADAIGIPYTLVLNDRTLADGIIGIRNRDTTLKEQSHIGIVVPYIEQLMKNY